MRRLLITGLLALGACSNPAGPRSEDLGGPGMTGMPDLRATGRDLSVAVMDLQAEMDLRPPADLFSPPDIGADYPAGPYGHVVGDTLSPMAWEGYVNPSAAGVASARPYTAYNANDLRKSGARYALIYAADYF